MARRPNRPARTNPVFIKILLTGFMDKLLIPRKYVKLHPETLGKKCVLWPTHTQNSWRVRTKLIDSVLYFKKGWDKFAKHHSLQFGDFLIFRHVRNSEFDVDVVDKSGTPREPAITSKNDQRVKDSAPAPTSQHKKTRLKTKALSAADALISSSEFPCFKKIMKPAYVRSNAYLHVPLDFSEEHLKKNTENVKIELLNKAWTVKVLRRPYYETRTLLSSGWSDLARENSLQVHDVCVFQLISTKDNTLKLTIFKHTSEKNQRHKQCQDRQKSTNPKLTPKSKELFDKAFEEAEKFQSTSKYHSVVIAMQPAYVDNGYLHVPLAFHEEMCKKEGVNEVKLQYSNEERKVIMISVGERQCRLSKGWGSFVKENSVEVGDACVLELINKQDNVIKVSIFKRNI